MTDGIPFSILVVEDDEDDRFIIDEAFKSVGYNEEVKKFTNGKAMIHYLDQVGVSLLPSLIVLDNTLPELEAGDILSHLKKNPSYQGIPVVIYTTTLSPSKKEKLMNMGAYACFEKGNTMKEIVDIVKDLKAIAEARPKD